VVLKILFDAYVDKIPIIKEDSKTRK